MIEAYENDPGGHQLTFEQEIVAEHYAPSRCWWLVHSGPAEPDTPCFELEDHPDDLEPAFAVTPEDDSPQCDVEVELLVDVDRPRH